MTRLRLLIALLATTLSMPAAFASPALAAPNDLLPDLQMAPIYGVQLTTKSGRKRLRFGTIVYNVGDGAIEVQGRKRVGNEMSRVSQWIYRADGSRREVVKPDARMIYSGDGHDHYHVARFIVARLTRTDGSADERPLRKIGFCLVDLLPMPGRDPGEIVDAAYRSCGSTKSIRVRMGISVGWGDDYAPDRPYQSIDVTKLPAGSYRLCATVNPKGIWTEEDNDRANNSYWLDVELDAANNDMTVIGGGSTACS